MPINTRRRPYDQPIVSRHEPSGGRGDQHCRRPAARDARAAERRDRAAGSSGDRGRRQHQRRRDQRDPDAGKPGLGRRDGDHGEPHIGGSGAQPPGGRDVPRRDHRVRPRPARPTAHRSAAEGERGAHGVPPPPRHGPHDRARRGRPAARRDGVATPRPGVTPVAGRGTVAGVGAHRHRRPVPARAVRRVQPTALLDLVAPDSASADLADPAAAAALHRLLAVHRVVPRLPATVDLRAFDRIEICGGQEGARRWRGR